MNNLPNVVQTCELNLYGDDMEIHCNNANVTGAENNLQQIFNVWICGSVSIFWLLVSEILISY